MTTTTCPECGGTITFNSTPVMHELVKCPDCGKELEVTSVDPVEVAVPEVAEDWGE